MNDYKKTKSWNDNEYMRDFHNGVNFIVDQIEKNCDNKEYKLSPSAQKYLFTYGITVSNCVSESGIVTPDQLCDLMKICNALKRFGSDDGFAGNQGDAFCNFILHHIEHDSGNKEDLPEDFISHYSQHE
jgi:hypothetical protein